MEQQRQLEKPIYKRSPDYVGSTPFEGDAFEREKLANQLTNLIMRLNEGCTIAIDAPWGEGKTWFAQNWCSKLDSEGFKTIYLDAFACDFSEDPFVPIASEILSAFRVEEGDESGKRLWSSAKQLGKALLPAASKIAINAVGRVLLGTSDLSENVAEVGKQVEAIAAEAAEKYIEGRLKEHEHEKISVDEFRKSLAEFASAQPRPVVFFIDELDRCKPAFAVQVVERIKHLFDVPNLVFVLMLNRDQLERAIKGVYGSAIDSHAYLGKFVHLFFTLPKKQSREASQSNANWQYCWVIAKRYGQYLENSRAFKAFVSEFSIYASELQLSLRDIEKAVALFILSGADASAPNLAWLVALKLKHPRTFLGLIRNDKKAHRDSISMLLGITKRGADIPSATFFMSLHRGYLEGFEQLSSEEREKILGGAFSRQGVSAESIMGQLLSRIDFAVE